MAFTNFETKEINCKILYFGAPGSGKTTNLRAVYQQTSAEIKSGLLELSEGGGTTQFFDFLPVSLGQVRDYHLKLHLYALPPHTLYPTLNSVILKGVDGVIFVADSRLEWMAANIDHFLQMKRLLASEGYNVVDLPRVIQYNKRDTPARLPIEALRRELNPAGLPDQEAVATNGIGTVETLQLMAKLVLQKLAPV